MGFNFIETTLFYFCTSHTHTHIYIYNIFTNILTKEIVNTTGLIYNAKVTWSIVAADVQINSNNEIHISESWNTWK